MGLTQEIGRRGENEAVDFLKKKKYKIIGRNFRTSKFGEIDIIAEDNNQLIFVEVKAKTNYNFGAPEEEFTRYKKKKMRRAIQDYFWAKKLETENWRIDLIAVDFLRDRTEIRQHTIYQD